MKLFERTGVFGYRLGMKFGDDMFKTGTDILFGRTMSHLLVENKGCRILTHMTSNRNGKFTEPKPRVRGRYFIIKFLYYVKAVRPEIFCSKKIYNESAINQSSYREYEWMAWKKNSAQFPFCICDVCSKNIALHFLVSKIITPSCSVQSSRDVHIICIFIHIRRYTYTWIRRSKK